MNIFFLDRDPTTCAQMACDSHVNKMVVETAQILGTTCRLHPNGPIPYHFAEVSYANHPSTLWCRMSLAHYDWLVAYRYALISEHEYRFGVRRTGALITNDMYQNYRPNLPQTDWLCDPTPALGDYRHLIVEGDVVATYRAYYVHAKSHLLTYTRRSKPQWITTTTSPT